jgi:hypothetical protein
MVPTWEEEQQERLEKEKKLRLAKEEQERLEKDQERLEKARQRTLHIIYAHVTLGVTTCCIPIQAEPMLFNAIAKKDVVVAARLLSSATACMGLVSSPSVVSAVHIPDP